MQEAKAVKSMAWSRFDGLVKSMVLEYNKQNAGSPVVEAVVWQVMIPAGSRTGNFPREVLRHVRVIDGAPK